MSEGTGYTGAVIVIRDLAAWAVVGVHDHEREMAQPLMMQLEIEFPACPATATDDLKDTIDYAEIVTDLRLWLRGTRFFLLERLADALVDRIFSRFGAWRVSAQVMKGPILEGVGSVGIRLERLAPSKTLLSQANEETHGNRHKKGRPAEGEGARSRPARRLSGED